MRRQYGAANSTGVAGNQGERGGAGRRRGGQRRPGRPPGDASVTDGPVHPNDAGSARCRAPTRAGHLCLPDRDAHVCDNVCVDIQTDNDHCGDCATRCGHTSACNAGKCGAPPTVVLAAPSPVAARPPAVRCDSGRRRDDVVLDRHAEGHREQHAGGRRLPHGRRERASGAHAPAGGRRDRLLARARREEDHEAGLVRSATLVVAAPATAAQIGGFAVAADGLTVYFSSSRIDTMARPQAAISKVAAAGGTVTVLGEQDHGVPAAVAVAGNFVASRSTGTAT